MAEKDERPGSIAPRWVQAEEMLNSQTSVLESMATGVNVTDQNAIIIYSNPAFDAMFGYERDELIGKHVSILNAESPEENALIVEEISAQLRTAGSWRGEFYNIRKDGTPFTTYTRINDLEVSGETYWISIQDDITERVQAEAALDKERKMLRTIIDTVFDFIYVKDVDGRYLISNPAHARSLGKSSVNDVVGKSNSEVHEPKVAAQYDADEQAIIQTGQPRVVKDEVRINQLGEPIWMSTTKVPLRDSEGQIIGIVGISRDITAAKQAEDKLIDSNLRFTQISEYIDDAFWLMDAEAPNNATIIFLNPAFERIWQRSAAELYQDPALWYECIHEEDKERVVKAFTNFIQGDGDYELEYRIVRPDNTVRTIADQGNLVRDENGKITRVAGIARDITERKRAEVAL